jgi:hypothetical protein
MATCCNYIVACFCNIFFSYRLSKRQNCVNNIYVLHSISNLLIFTCIITFRGVYFIASNNFIFMKFSKAKGFPEKDQKTNLLKSNFYLCQLKTCREIHDRLMKSAWILCSKKNCITISVKLFWKHHVKFFFSMIKITHIQFFCTLLDFHS